MMNTRGASRGSGDGNNRGRWAWERRPGLNLAWIPRESLTTPESRSDLALKEGHSWLGTEPIAASNKRSDRDWS